MKSTFVLLFAVALLSAAQAPAAGADASGTQRLKQFYSQVHTLTADFDQRVLNAQGDAIQSAAGHVVIQRPGRFRWSYTKPYRQLIVADGRTLWIYDPDLEQATVKPMDQSLQDTPALLLSRKTSLGDTFEIRDQGEKQGLAWVLLLPKAKDSSFKQVLIGLDAKGPRVMELTDAFDQITRLRFTHLQINVTVDDAQFRFRPPPGADVIKE